MILASTVYGLCIPVVMNYWQFEGSIHSQQLSQAPAVECSVCLDRADVYYSVAESVGGYDFIDDEGRLYLNIEMLCEKVQ